MKKLLVVLLLLIAFNCKAQYVENYSHFFNIAGIQKITIEGNTCVLTLYRANKSIQITRIIYTVKGKPLDDGYLIDEVTLMGKPLPLDYQDGNLKSRFKTEPEVYDYVVKCIQSAWIRSKQ